jgi:hypothetical protein
MPETTWLRTPDGRVRINVLKSFLFLHKEVLMTAEGVERISARATRQFAPGEHLLDPKVPDDAEVLAHPWISEQFADGHIESPQKTRERLEAEAAVATAAAAVKETNRERLLAEAEAAFAGVQRAAERAARRGDELRSDLDTPLNQLPR